MDNALDDLVFRFESELTPATDSRLGDSLAALRAIADGVTDELDDGSSDAEPIDHKAAEPVEIRSTAELAEVAETAEAAEVAETDETDETDEVAEVAEAAELAVTEPAPSVHAVEPAERVRPEEAGPPVEDRVPDHEDTSWSTARRQRRQLLAALPQSDGIASSPNSDETHFGDASQPSAAASEVVESEVVPPEVIEPQTSASVRDESDYRESVPDTPAMIARTTAPVSDDDGDSGNVGEPQRDVAEPPSRSEPQRATILSRKIVRVDPQTGRRTEEYLTEQPPTPDRVRREGSRPGEPVRRAGRSETVVRQATPAPQVPLTEEVSPADQASASSAVADQSIRGHRDPAEPTTAAPLDKIDYAEPESRSNDHDIEDTDRNDRGLDDPRLEDPDLEDTLAEDPEDPEDRIDLEAPGQSDWGLEYGSAADSDIADSDIADSDNTDSDNTDSDITDSDITDSDIAHSDNTDSDITDSDIAHSDNAHSNIARSASDGRDLDRDLVEEYDLPAFLRGTIADGDQVDRHVEELENQPLVQSQPQSGSQAPLAGRPGPPPTPAPPTGRPTPPDDREIVHIGPEPAAPVKPFATRQSLENIGSSGWKEAIENSSDKPANDTRTPVPEDYENYEDYEDDEDDEGDEDYGYSHELEHLDGEVADRDGDLFAPADLFGEVDPVNDDVSGFHAEPDSDADPNDESIVDTDAHRTPPIQIPAQPAPNPQPTTPSAPAMGSDAGDGPPSPWRARIAASAGIALLMIGTVFLLTSFVGGDDETPDSDPTTIDTPVDATGVDPAIDTTDTTAADLGSGNAPGATVTVQSSRLSAEALTCNRLDGLSAIVETTESTAIVISVMARFLDRDGNALVVHEPVTVVAAPAIRSVVTFPYDDDQVSGDDRFAEPTCELIVSEADG